ncbi:hypothetical protein BGW42_007763, partial [Actinomortierella wolfii]
IDFSSYCENNGNMDVLDHAVVATGIMNPEQHGCLAILLYNLYGRRLEALWFQAVIGYAAVLHQFGPNKPLLPALMNTMLRFFD